MTPFEAYKMFLAVKAHFTQASYDYIKYNGHMKVGYDSFDRRRDKFFFTKLAGMKDLQGFLVANFAERDIAWVGELVSDEANETYLRWQGRQQSLTYTFKTELSLLADDFKASMMVAKGQQYPRLLTLYRQNKISIETMSILNDMLTFVPYWDKVIVENVIWPATKSRLIKYSRFVTYDKAKFEPLVREMMQVAA
jgi:hypothetical protein